MKMDPKSTKIYAAEEITKKKKTIKLGNIYEENVGTQTQHFEGQEIGGPNKNQVVMYYSNKLFYIIPLEKSYTFKKQLSHVDSSVQEELLNFSNDPEYAQTKLKSRKEVNAGTKAVEQHSEKARADLGINSEDNREEILKDALRKRNEKRNAKRNKEDADFDNDEIFQDNEENDVAQKGLEYIESDGDSEIENFGKKNKDNTNVKVAGTTGGLNQYGREMLSFKNKESQREEFDDDDSDDGDDISDGSDEGEASEDDSDADKRKDISNKDNSTSKARKPPVTEEFKYSGGLDDEPDFEIENDHYVQPQITKNLSNSSDLFAATPTNQGKRQREEDDDVFGDEPDYKRFKND